MSGSFITLRLFVAAGAMSVLAACMVHSSPVRTTESTDHSRLTIERGVDHLAFDCEPVDDSAARRLQWVEDCNLMAYDHLLAQVDLGIRFGKEVRKNVFGMASVQAAQMIVSGADARGNYAVAGLAIDYPIIQ